MVRSPQSSILSIPGMSPNSIDNMAGASSQSYGPKLAHLSRAFGVLQFAEAPQSVIERYLGLVSQSLKRRNSSNGNNNRRSRHWTIPTGCAPRRSGGIATAGLGVVRGTGRWAESRWYVVMTIRPEATCQYGQEWPVLGWRWAS